MKLNFTYRQKFVYVIGSRLDIDIRIILIHLPSDHNDVKICVISICQVEIDSYAAFVSFTKGLRRPEDLLQMRSLCEEGDIKRIVGAAAEGEIYRAEEVLDFDELLSNAMIIKDYIPGEGEEEEVSDAIDYFEIIYILLNNML